MQNKNPRSEGCADFYWHFRQKGKPRNDRGGQFCIGATFFIFSAF